MTLRELNTFIDVNTNSDDDFTAVRKTKSLPAGRVETLSTIDAFDRFPAVNTSESLGAECSDHDEGETGCRKEAKKLRNKFASGASSTYNESIKCDPLVEEYADSLLDRAAMLWANAASKEARDEVSKEQEKQQEQLDGMPSGSAGSHNSSAMAAGRVTSFSQPVTTLMLCNLPCKLSSEGLQQVVHELGFEESYDLIHVPRGAKHYLGYGFVNFKEPQAAARFVVALQSHTFAGTPEKKAYCKVARFQGFETNFRMITRGSNYRKRSEYPLVR